ncbi:DUF4304 domain-containing protein [Rhizobium lentis]|nr:DUF4304 domain-containing protein [Rhizobium lentis]
MLRAHGFKKSGRNWHKADGENWLIVNVQGSRSNFGDRGQFTVNLGVNMASVAPSLERGQLPASPRSTSLQFEKGWEVLSMAKTIGGSLSQG